MFNPTVNFPPNLLIPKPFLALPSRKTTVFMVFFGLFGKNSHGAQCFDISFYWLLRRNDSSSLHPL